MAHAQQHTHSLWQETTVFPTFPPLATSVSTDVCVVGAGIAGLMTAYRLLQKGRRVVVIDKDPLGFNETAHSTAHLVSALDDRFFKLRKTHGREGARLAYSSHAAAVDLIENIVATEGIECGFKRLNGYLFLAEEHDKRYLEREKAAALDAGCFDVSIVAEPEEEFFEAGQCLRFPRQAQMDPAKFMLGLCENIRKRGGLIFPETKGDKFQGGLSAYVETSEGHRVSCQDIVVATNVPINDWMTVHIKEAAYRTYVIGLKVPRERRLPALFWDTTDPYHYVRFASDPLKDYDVVLVGGEDHRVGQISDPENSFSRLRDWAARRLRIEGEVVSSWSGQIVEPMDGLAYIGRNPGDHDNVYIATGDSGNGTTHGAIASMIISDLIVAGEHPWADLYDPRRFNWRGITRFISENFQNSVQYRDWISSGDNKDLEELLPGEGCVISEGLTKTAVLRNEDGGFQRLSATCPHMGGVVRWNEAEETWDCPVHGSRFNKNGEVLNGPAKNNLSPEQRPAEEPTPPRKKEDSLDV
ncbi:FAD-dependent oxidoreductase [Bdellovibrio sp. 22V]|uniref:FAD-dependent oxidoreductase n=1 Tax=Bdellovibrio sp. 22V TaxID=3044166 RepID=UPI002543BC3D|nr:FAD-dependent oxidoreductase [Bdellovibrio sp. 22V]WII72281.1 FAD-dependent oxidoreductase [Bdellovibrio sp. 22V]